MCYCGKFPAYAVTCNSLPEIVNHGVTNITYTPPHGVFAHLPDGQRYIGTTVSCSPGYQLVEGSSVRVCGSDGTWSGMEQYCGNYRNVI